MIHNLFDEYRFFNKYPEKELRITAILFGTLIRHDLTASFDTSFVLRYIYGIDREFELYMVILIFGRGTSECSGLETLSIRLVGVGRDSVTTP